jgi:predicted dehydrogenase
LARDYGVVAEPNVSSLLARSDIDAVIIGSPHSEHATNAVEAAQRGKHILLDKPMATSVEECDRILDAVRQASVTLMMGFSQRFRTCNIAAHRLIRQGEIGRVTMILERSLSCGGLASLPPWQSKPENVGTLLGHAIHNIDRIRWLTGQEIVNVAAQVQRELPSGNEVSTMALFGLSGGAMASLWASWALPKPGFPHSEFSAWIVGEGGLLDLDAYGILRLGRGTSWTVVAEQAPVDWKGKGMLDANRLESYRMQGQELINSIREGRQPSATGEDGRAAVQVAVAAYQSAAEGRTIALTVKDDAK